MPMASYQQDRRYHNFSSGPVDRVPRGELTGRAERHADPPTEERSPPSISRNTRTARLRLAEGSGTLIP